MNLATLARKAFGMRAIIELPAPSRNIATLRPRPGVEVILLREEETISLKILSEDQPVSPEDLSTFAEAFKVPTGSDPLISRRRITQPVSSRPVQQHIATWQWMEART